MPYTHDWFGNNGKNWIKWLNRYINKPDIHFLEIGCFEGRATVWLLEHILINPTARITVIDTFEGSVEHKKLDVSSMYNNFIENTKKYFEKIIVHVGTSGDILPTLEPDTYDFIYIDGSHQAVNVLEDAVLSWRLLKRQGVIIFDDYSWGDDKYKDELMKPRIAIDAFLRIYKGLYYLVKKDRQVCIVKL